MKNNPEELFKQLKEKLDISPENQVKLSKEDIEYLSAVIILELDKGKRLNTLSEMDKGFIESLTKIVVKKSLPKKDVYNKITTDSKIDKKI